MGLIDDTAEAIRIPHEPDETMEIRGLAWFVLDQAEDQASANRLARIPPEVLLGQAEDERKSDEQRKATTTIREPLDRYDWFTVLRHGIKKWSYPLKKTADTVKMLDHKTARWAVQEILSRSVIDEAQGNT